MAYTNRIVVAKPKDKVKQLVVNRRNKTYTSIVHMLFFKLTEEGYLVGLEERNGIVKRKEPSKCSQCFISVLAQTNLVRSSGT